jgi:epoxide hydrolase 4
VSSYFIYSKYFSLKDDAMVQTYMQPLPHGITLSCRAMGEKGQPVLAFLHGFPEGAFVWDGLLEHFSRQGYRCIAPNLRGFEKSSSPLDAAQYRAKHLVQDIAALIAIESPGQPLACLVAHDWGGAVAWNLANQMPQLLHKLCIVNSPHPGTFLRELKHSAAQQAASAYMNFLIRPDAEKLLAEDDYRRLWEFFTNMFAATGPHAWLTEEVKAQYRAVWGHGLTGGCNYYRASPLRPPTAADKGAAAIDLPHEMLTVNMPTLVIWGEADIALPPALVDGLQDYVPQLELHRIAQATHWIVHEQPQLVIGYLQQFLQP